MKIFEPKPPPTSGAITRNLCSGAMPTKAAMTRRATVRILRSVPQRKLIIAGIVFGQRGARLDRVRHQPIVDDVELGDVLGGCKGRVDRLGIAEMTIRRSCSSARYRGFAGPILPWPGRPPRAALRNRPSLFLRRRAPAPAFRAITTATASPTWLTLSGCQRRMRRHLHRRAVFGMDHPAANQIADFVAGQFGAGEHGDDTRHRFGSSLRRCS